jgi:hypothetical protein
VIGMTAVLNAVGVACFARAANATKPPTACARADDFLAAGETAAAKKAYVALLAKGPTPCATAALKKLNAPAAQSFTDRVTGWTKLLAGLAVPLIALFFVGSLIFVGLTHITAFRRGFRNAWGFRTGLRPRLAVKSLSDSGVTKDAAGVEAAVRASLSRLSRAQETHSGHYNLDTIHGVEGLESKVSKLGDVAPQFTSIAAIIGFVSSTARLPRYELQGTIADRTGCDITVMLEDRSGVNSAATLRTNLGDHPDPYGYLALVAGGWADYRVRQIEDIDLPTTTQSAESYGQFRAGVAYEDQFREQEALNAYVDAIDSDSENIGALVNLALLLRSHEQFEMGVALLQGAFDALERRAP